MSSTLPSSPTPSSSPTVQRQQVLNEIARICVQKGICNFILSPGSRSAPLTLAFSRHPHLHCRVVYDERSAAYIALGLAKQSGRPVGLVCTSGTAALNYAPAVTEAHYQQVPLLVFTADRPSEWIDQQDNQSIHQVRLYEPHCRGSFELPVDMDHADARWHALRITSEAINRAMGLLPGPVHINVPLREPLYTAQATPPTPAGTNNTIADLPEADLPEIVSIPTEPQLDESAYATICDRWHGIERKLIVVGTQAPTPQLVDALSKLKDDPSVAIIGDITANIYPTGTSIYHSDAILGTQDQTTLDNLRPDLLVTCGGPLVSKYLKLFLRQHPPKAQWHILPTGDAPDTYQQLSHVIHMHPADFLATLAKSASLDKSTSVKQQTNHNHRNTSGNSYSQRWLQREEQAKQVVDRFLDGAEFGEFFAVRRVMQALPIGSRLQLGNSMPIRYANFIGHIPSVVLASVDANRGTSGIDGTVSTTVGAALADGVVTTLLVGDLAFFYDRNGLWHDHLPANLRIVVLNNHGGGIFDMIGGPDQLDVAERRTYFMTPQPLSARRTAADHGCTYVHCTNEATLQELLPTFFAAQDHPAILEIETDMAVNSALFRQFKAAVGSNLLGHSERLGGSSV